jgi:hypothetical protein
MAAVLEFPALIIIVAAASERQELPHNCPISQRVTVAACSRRALDCRQAE